jgi:hypothetical protein
MWKMFLVCAVLLVSSSAYALDCGDNDVVEGVAAIAKKNNVFLMDAVADFVHQRMQYQALMAQAEDAEKPKGPLPAYRYATPPPMWCADKAGATRLSSGESWRLYHMPCFNHNPSQQEIQRAFDSTGTGEGHSIGNPKDAVLTEMALGGPLAIFALQPKEKQEEIKNQIAPMLRYSVKTIRTKYHDPSTDELSCAAELKGGMYTVAGTTETYSVAIKYTVEVTTDKKLHIQVTKAPLEDGQMH